MRLALFLILLISGCGGYTEQEDYGWVEKPKRSVMEQFSRSKNRFDTSWTRDYYYTGQRLDSIIEIRFDSRSVHSQFGQVDGENESPADKVIISNRQEVYSKTKAGDWVLSGLVEETRQNGNLTRKRVMKIDSVGHPTVHHEQIFQYDSSGFATSRITYSKNGRYYGTRSIYDRDVEGKLVRTTQLSVRDTLRTTVQPPNDTERVTYYQYDDEGRLISYSDTTGFGPHAFLPSLTRVTDIVIHDSVAWLSLIATHGQYVLFPQRQFLKSGIHESYEGGKISRKRFRVDLDDRYRITRVWTDSSVSTTSYFDDNTIREKITRDKRGVVTHRRVIRHYDDKHRVVLQEEEWYDKDKSEFGKDHRIRFSY